MKKLVFAFAAVAAVCLASCGGNASTTETTTEEATAPVETVATPAENDSTAAVEEAATDSATTETETTVAE